MAVLTMILSGVYVLACLLLIVVVLLQQGKGGATSPPHSAAGAPRRAFGARAGASLLTRVTTVLGTLFMAGALLLAIIGQRGPGSVLGGLDAPEATPVAAEEPATLPEPAPTDASSEDDDEASETTEEPAVASPGRPGFGRPPRNAEVAERQTRQLEGLVGQWPVGVQIPPSAPFVGSVSRPTNSPPQSHVDLRFRP